MESKNYKLSCQLNHTKSTYPKGAALRNAEPCTNSLFIQFLHINMLIKTTKLHVMCHSTLVYYRDIHYTQFSLRNTTCIVFLKTFVFACFTCLHLDLMKLFEGTVAMLVMCLWFKFLPFFFLMWLHNPRQGDLGEWRRCFGEDERRLWQTHIVFTCWSGIKPELQEHVTLILMWTCWISPSFLH